MRITGGKARSIPLNCPKGSEVRPATDRMREAVFSSMGELMDGTSFLDLFAGAGCYGLEAISRGASRGMFVEHNRLAVESIKKNLAMVAKSAGFDVAHSKYSIQSADVFKWLVVKTAREVREKFQIVFIDPPYREVEKRSDELLKGIVPLLNQENGAYVFFEVPHALSTIPAGYECVRTFGKGREDTRGMLLRWQP